MDASSEATVDAVAGIGGGVVALLATYPLMTITTRYQTRREALPVAGSAQKASPMEEGRSGAGASKSAGKRAPRDLLRATARALESLYAGVGPALFGTICSQGSYYYFYSLLRRAVSGGSERSAVLSTRGTVLVSTVAGCINVLLNNPIWVIVTRMQHAGANARLTSTVKALYEESGIQMLWKGVWPALLMVSNPVVQFVLLEKATAVVMRQRAASGARPSAWKMLLIGAAAKLIATLLTYPMLVVKSVLQVSGPSNMIRALRDLWVRHGPLAFYRGVHTKLLQSVLAAALLFLVRARLQAAVRIALRVLRTRLARF